MAVPNPRYNRTAALVLGSLQIVVAIVCVCLEASMFGYDLVIAAGAVGFWAGFFILISGTLAVISWKFHHSGLIVGLMVMSIITAVVALAGIPTSAIMGIIGSFTSVARWEDDEYYKYKLQEGLTYSMTAFCLIEGILAIVMSTFCCQAVCCGAPQEMQVMYVTTSAAPAGVYVQGYPAQAGEPQGKPHGYTQASQEPPPYSSSEDVQKVAY